jgi:hypothetical protein
MYEFKIFDEIDRPCPKCKGKLSKVVDKDLFRCANCGVYMDAFVLTSVQLAAKKIKTSGEFSVVLDIGGKAAGKTFGNAVVVRDIASKLKGDFEFAVGAITLTQNKLAHKELIRKIPDEWIALTDKGKLDIKKPSAAGEGHIQLKNGVKIRFIPTKNLGSIKSESFFLIWMIEITEGNAAFYNELLFRSRGDMNLGMASEVKGLMIFETNSPDPDKPEQFFIEDMFWHKSKRVYWSQEKFMPADPDQINPEYITIVYDSFDNIENMSKSFISRAFEHKDIDEVELQRKGYVIQAGHKIYPTAGECISEENGYPGKVPWFSSIDQGVSDQMILNFYYVDPFTYQIFQFNEEVLNDMNVINATIEYHKVKEDYKLEMVYEIHDPIGCKKMFQRESDVRTITEKWAENGIDLVRSEINAVLPKIGRVQQLFIDAMFFMQRHCKVSIRQHINYKGIRTKAGAIKPQEKHDHTCEATRNAMSWIPMHVDKQEKQDRYAPFRQKVDRFMASRQYYTKSRVINGGKGKSNPAAALGRAVRSRSIRRL